MSGLGTGWGSLPWGGSSPTTAWSGAGAPDGFDIYVYYDSTSSLGAALEDPHLDHSGGYFESNLQYSLCMSSGGSAPQTTAVLQADYGVPSSWTLQAVLDIVELPADFSQLATRHVYVGASDTAGASCGVFLSMAGLAYAGPVALVDGALQLLGPFHVIPGTAGLLQQGTSYTIRLVVNTETDTVYVFATPTEDLSYGRTGHRLVAVLPAIPSTAGVTEGTMVSVRGTSAHPTWVCLTMLGMATGMLMPNVPPKADAGRDQAVRTCVVGQLDGSGSFDPEGGTLAYRWRIVDAPYTSAFALECHDGATQPSAPATGYTDTLYSVALGDASAIDPIEAGDVLLLDGVPHTIEEVGTSSTFFVRVATNSLPDSLAACTFKVLRQRYLSGRNSVKPTFLADIPGIYKFDLAVYDGEYLSDLSTTVVNVQESQTPRGCIPDLGFIWQYLSDFWKLVEDRDRIQVLWEGMAQVAAAELLTLWQVDYSKSLRDIQRSFQRRWLHYDLRLAEPLPTLSSFSAALGGVDSAPITTGGLDITAGSVVVFTSAAYGSVVVPFTAVGPYSAATLRIILQNRLGTHYTVTLVPAGTSTLARVTSDAEFSVESRGTQVFPAATNYQLAGSAGTRLGPRTYKVDRSLLGYAIMPSSILAVGGEGYLVQRVVDDPADEHRYQRVIVQGDLPLRPGGQWCFTPTISSKLLNFHAGMVTAGDTAVLEVVPAGGAITLVEVTVTCACEGAPSTLGINVAGALPGVCDVYLAYVTRHTHMPVSPLVTDIPALQEHISTQDSSAVLSRNVDFFLETFRGSSCLRFMPAVWEGAEPPARLWAEVTYIDNRPAIESNFGIAADFTLDQFSELATDTDYLSAVRGLWYAYLRGPTMHNLRVGAQILLGLPIAEEPGTIAEIRTDFSPKQGRILVRDSSNTAVVRSYTYPRSLPLEVNPDTGVAYAVGDAVQQFAPLVQGVSVVDYVKDPAWFEGLLNQGVFFEVEKFHRFMMRVDSTAFSLSALLFVRSFVARVKPTYTFPMFVVQVDATQATVDVTDEVVSRGRLILNDGARFNAHNYSTMFDDYRAAGGRVRNQFDANSELSDADPAYPTSDGDIEWGIDKNYLAPEDVLEARWELTHTAGVVSLDAGYRFDAGQSPTVGATLTGVTTVPGAGLVLLSRYSPLAGTLASVRLVVQGRLGSGDSGAYNLVVTVGASTVATIPVTIAVGGYIATPFAITAAAGLGDTIEVRLVPASGQATTPSWVTVAISVDFVGEMFTFDTGLAAGTYSISRTL